MNYLILSWLYILVKTFAKVQKNIRSRNIKIG
jgi:hypothetical protein